MVSVEISLASEITSVLNFLVIDILLLAYITHISGLLAGHTNHHILNSRGTVHLRTFNAPLIGGGLVTAKGPRRSLLILLRLSVVVAAAACNFGLEGRSRQSFTTTLARVRYPGPLLNDDGNAPTGRNVVDVAHSATVVRRNCFNLSGGSLAYGDVIDSRCYRDSKKAVFIRSLSLDSTSVETKATNCVAEQDCSTYRTIFRCREADMVCTGFLRPRRCPCVSSAGPCRGERPRLQRDNCVAVVYAENGREGWMCDREKVYPNKTGGMDFCMKFEARRKDVEDWVTFYLSITQDQEEALFVAAYGQPRKEMVRVPTGEERAVTVVNLFWFISVGWMVVVTSGLSVWRVAHMWRGTPLVAHDEAGLARLLDRQIEARRGMMGVDEFPEWDNDYDITDDKKRSRLTVVLRK